jgi:hypothetical protein
MPHLFECITCLKYANAQGANLKHLKTVWQIKSDEVKTLPPAVRIISCTGCGSLGIKMITEIAI